MLELRLYYVKGMLKSKISHERSNEMEMLKIILIFVSVTIPLAWNGKVWAELGFTGVILAVVCKLPAPKIMREISDRLLVGQATTYSDLSFVLVVNEIMEDTEQMRHMTDSFGACNPLMLCGRKDGSYCLMVSPDLGMISPYRSRVSSYLARARALFERCRLLVRSPCARRDGSGIGFVLRGCGRGNGRTRR